MLAYAVLIRGKINAVDLIFSYIAVQPLNLRPHLPQDIERTHGEFPNLGFREFPGPWDFAFDHELWHGVLVYHGF